VSVLSETAKLALLRSGHYARRMSRLTFPGVAVLCYHGVVPGAGERMAFGPLHVTAAAFEGHCRVIRKLCNPVSFAEWQAAMDGGPPLPPRAVLVTFDDGYRTILTLAKPILERYGIPAVAFICSDPVEQRVLLWYDAVARLRGEDAAEQMKNAPFAEWRRLVQSAMTKADDADPQAVLRPDEIRALARVPGFEIGAHTASHVMLARATPEEQRNEIVRNKAALEAWTDRPVTLLAYPNGRPGEDYTPESVDIVRASGFAAAFSMRTGFATASQPRFELPRFLMMRAITAPDLAHRFAYSWYR